ncbi:MAG TPA: hypothetical protein VEA16_14545 [Vicinamibacterales bacterium]|nr:hypothetical protein [Vicinamibacterales bacterium]
MTERRFGESDHEPLREDDILKQAVSEWREEMPSRDLWSGIKARIDASAQPVVARQRFFQVTMAQMAIAASLLMAVASGVTWMIARQPATDGGNGTAANQQVIQAYGVPEEETSGQIVQANFADAQFNAAVEDLEQILRDERDRLDPRTVLIIERNLKAIDDAINEARMALNNDPANPYLNSHLADARRRKLDLLRHATSLASGGD